jgi:dTMP kinase
VLDVADDIAEARVAPARDRMERAGDEFHRRVRAAYRDLAAPRGWIVVDGSGTIDEVEARVRASLGSLLDAD